jgi:hypothetical protein
MIILGTPVQDALFWMSTGVGLSAIIAGLIHRH